jgi:hypothetical protein
MIPKTSLAALSILVLASSFCIAPVQSAQPVLTGEVCDVRVHQLTSQIHWYENLHQAEAEAQKEGKLIFWMHMLGHIDGAT